MPPKATSANGKRKASSPSPSPSKKVRSDGASAASPAEQHGLIDRRYYPPEMTNARCKEYVENKHPRPIEVLEKTISTTQADRDKIPVKDAVVHWFKMDLRTHDNKSLHLAAEKAKSKGVPLICVYLVSPQDLEAHLTAPVRLDFTLRTLEALQKDLAELEVPLYVETVEKRRKLPARLLELCKEWGAAHLFANMEYEVDELRRDDKLTKQGLDEGIAVSVVHDTCAVPPSQLSSGAGKQYSVYSPWYRAWMAHLHKHPHLLKPVDPPSKNPVSARKTFSKLFDCKIPETPESKRLDDQDRKRFKSLWPPGEHEARDRLDKFLTETIGEYSKNRNFPAKGSTAMLSVHFAAGTISARTAITAAQERNSSKKLDSGNNGIVGWISEVAWRDFYKHVLAHWPFVCMNKCFKAEYTSIEWEYNPEHFEAWREGRTGYPIVDAAMRQMRTMAYSHNRCRMIVASFLSKDLMLDWRMGEQHFMNSLIDGDFASNNGGWGFSASVGVDPQPYFRIFNPTLQSEKFDADGEYIRKWVPELKDVKGKAIHEPYARGAADIAKRNGYPKPIVEHKAARERALSRYKAGLGRSTA